MIVKVTDLSGGRLPFRAHPHDAGADLYAIDEYILPARGTVAVDTGIAVHIPIGHVGLIHPRSGLAANHGITVLNAPGTIDAGYTGEVKVLLHNTNNHTHLVRRGDRIAQLVVQRVELCTFEWGSGGGVRGDNGFGSTG